MQKNKYFDLVYKIDNELHLVFLNNEQLEKLNILINVLDEITISKEPFATIKEVKKEEKPDV